MDEYVKDKNEKIKVDELRIQIVKSLNRDFLRNFKIEIESGNHVRVQNALLDAAEELRAITLSESGLFTMVSKEEADLIKVIDKKYKGKIFSREELDEILSSHLDEDKMIKLAQKDFGNFGDRQTCVIAALWVFGVAFVVAAVAIYVFVVEVIAFWVDVCISVSDWIFTAIQRSDSQLSREQLINSITTSFAN